MKAPRVLVMAMAGVALAASVTGCQAPGSDRQALSFAGHSYTEGQVSETTRQLNELVSASNAGQGAPMKFSRIQTMTLLMYSPIIDNALAPEQEQVVDAQLKALAAVAPEAGTPTSTTKEAFRNFLVVQSDSMGIYTTQVQQLVAANPPKFSSRYGHVDDSQLLPMPNFGGGVAYAPKTQG
ncbi:hypothetical protein H8R18_02375 [Nanchangia anserum]|uniref:Lipoprotein n=1 Tax=Nanchangia anserum TaxID=2692125 RepID=A0A8I0KWG5_9ACTO|nr:hypothetical protein [Nanchangia anserum]MBD3689979.1 hypothetical protein [Nanchangia anserum]QOX82218.1 hypothetical protein H8R18_02375 [Nanchangia anserum]